MVMKRMTRWLRLLLPLPMLMLGGCASQDLWLFNAKGLISGTERHYMILDVVIMLCIVIPTAILAIWSMWRYRKGGNGAYSPKWSHSYAIEAVVWGVPLITVGILSYLSVKAIYDVNPYNPGVMVKAQKAAGGDPVDVDVIATDWRWLFIYPKEHIASVNELVVPVNTPVHFRLTSTSVVNDFIIPQLVGMIDVMPGMRVKQALLANEPGVYQGFSADYSGAGFSWMHFQTKAVSQAKYEQWVQEVKKSPQHMTYSDFNRFAEPYIDVSHGSEYFSDVDGGLFDHVIQEVMDGKVWPTPMGMTENMVKYMQEQRAKQTAGGV